MRCPNCNQWNRASLPRCQKCGHPLEMENQLQPSWKVAYEPGSICAVAYDENGAEMALAPGQTFISAIPGYGSVDF